MNRPFTRRSFLKVLAGGAALGTTPVTSFAWPWRGSPRGSLRLLFMTDIHARTEWDTPLALERAARAMNARQADLIIAGGDLISEGFDSSPEAVAPEWDVYLTMQGTLHGHVYPVVGNRDLVAAAETNGSPPSADPRDVFRARLGRERTYFSFDALGYHFVVLDSVHVTGDELQYEGRVWPEQLEWVRSDLAKVPGRVPIILATHLPLLTAFFASKGGATAAAPRNMVVVNSRQVLELFSDHHLLLVLQGHLHIRESIRWRGTTFLTGGAICGNWWRGPRFGAEEGFYVLTLRRERLECEYVDYGWEARRPIGS